MRLFFGFCFVNRHRLWVLVCATALDYLRFELTRRHQRCLFQKVSFVACDSGFVRTSCDILYIVCTPRVNQCLCAPILVRVFFFFFKTSLFLQNIDRCLWTARTFSLSSAEISCRTDVGVNIAGREVSTSDARGYAHPQLDHVGLLRHGACKRAAVVCCSAGHRTGIDEPLRANRGTTVDVRVSEASIKQMRRPRMPATYRGQNR